DAERRGLVVDMRVYVDEARRYDRAADILDPARAGREVLADGGDPAGLDGDVDDAVDAVALVEHVPALQDEIVAPRFCRFTHRDSPVGHPASGRACWPTPHVAFKDARR